MEYGDIRPGGVAETDGVERDLAAEPGGQGRERGGGERSGAGGFLGGLAEKFADALGGAHGFLDLAEELGRLPHRAGDERRVEHETRELSRSDAAALEQPGAEPEHDHDTAKKRHDEERDEHRPPPRRAEGGGQHAGIGAVVATELEGFVGEGFDAGDRLQRFLDNGVGRGELVLRLSRESPQAAPEEDGGSDE